MCAELSFYIHLYASMSPTCCGLVKTERRRGRAVCLPLLRCLHREQPEHAPVRWPPQLKSSTADFGKRQSEVDPKLCERRGACGCLDLYCNVVMLIWICVGIRTQANLSGSQYKNVGRSETLNCLPFQSAHRWGKVNGLIFVCPNQKVMSLHIRSQQKDVRLLLNQANGIRLACTIKIICK